MLRTIGLLVALVAAVSSQSLVSPVVARKQPPAIDFLGAGYDALFGDPLASDSDTGPADPGFRLHIVNYTWTEDSACSGLPNNWICPEEASLLPTTTCVQDSSAEQLNTLSDVRKSMKQDARLSVSISGSYGGFSASAAFSGSSGMRKMSQVVSDQEKSTFESKAVCVLYTATLTEEVPTPNDRFVEEVNQLPDIYKPCYTPVDQPSRRLTANNVFKDLTKKMKDAALAKANAAKAAADKAKAAAATKQQVTAATAVKQKRATLRLENFRCPKRTETTMGDVPNVRDASMSLQELVGLKPEECTCDASVIAYFQFIKQFGTHYTALVEMGGKMIHRTEILRSKISELKSKSTNIAWAASAKASYNGAFGGGFSASMSAASAKSQQQRDYEETAKVTSSVTDINIGGDASDGWTTWAASLQKAPMPVRYDLRPLSDLIWGISPQKAALFEDAIEDYLGAFTPPESAVDDDAVRAEPVRTFILDYTLTPPARMKKKPFYVIWGDIFIGDVGVMVPVKFSFVGNTDRGSPPSGKITIPIPTKYWLSVSQFQENVPITMTVRGSEMRKDSDSTKKNHNLGGAIFASLQPWAILETGEKVALDDKYFGKSLRVNAGENINPIE